MKSNTPNTEFEKKIFAKLPNFSIVGNTVSQNYQLDQVITNTQKTAEQQKQAEQPITTTPSLIKGDKGDKGNKGDKGDKGNKGDKGDKGDNGIADARIITITVCTSRGTEQIEVYAPQD